MCNMELFQHVLQVCCLITLMVPINSYVLFAANVDDFRNLAKQFIPEEVVEKLTVLVSQNGDKLQKNRLTTNKETSFRQRKNNRTAPIEDDDAVSSEITMYRIKERQQHRPNEPANRKAPIKFEYDETHDTKISKAPSLYHGSTNLRNRPSRLEPENYDKRFKGKRPIQVDVEYDNSEEQSDGPKKELSNINFQRDKIPIANVKKRPRGDTTERKKSFYNGHENPRDNLDEIRFENSEQKNSYVKKLPIYPNDDKPNSYSKIRQDESRFINEELDSKGKIPKYDLKTVTNKWQPHVDYDYDDTTKVEEKRYRTVTSRISNTNSRDLSLLNSKDNIGRVVTPKGNLFLKRENREIVRKEKQKALSAIFTIPDRDYDMRQKKVTSFGIRELKSQGKGNEMIIKNGREIRDRKPQKQKVMEGYQPYEKTYPPKPTNDDNDPRYKKPYPSKPTKHDYDLPYEKPHPPASTKNDYDVLYEKLHPPKPTKSDYALRYEKPHPPAPTQNDDDLLYEKLHPSKPTNNDYDLPYKKPHQSKPTKNDYDVPYEKPHQPKPTKNDYDVPYEKPHQPKPTKNDYDVPYEKPHPSKSTSNDYDLPYEKPLVNKPTTNNYEKPFLTEKIVPVNDDDYFDDDNLNPTVKPVRVSGVNTQHKLVKADDIFTSSGNPSDPRNKKKKENVNLDVKKPLAEEEPEIYGEVVHEPIKARTERLNFDVDYDNNTDEVHTTRYTMKGTGIPTRQTFKMISPDYYKRLPRIVEKYDFSEPIPEADREREVPNDKLVLEEGRVNKKVKQTKDYEKRLEERPEFEPIKEHHNDPGAIMEEYSLVR